MEAAVAKRKEGQIKEKEGQIKRKEGQIKEKEGQGLEKIENKINLIKSIKDDGIHWIYRNTRSCI